MLQLEINGLDTLTNTEMVKLAVKCLGRKGAVRAIAADCQDSICTKMVKDAVDAIADGGVVEEYSNGTGVEITINKDESSSMISIALPEDEEDRVKAIDSIRNKFGKIIKIEGLTAIVDKMLFRNVDKS